LPVLGRTWQRPRDKCSEENCTKAIGKGKESEFDSTIRKEVLIETCP
jgi:hypothetical protein